MDKKSSTFLTKYLENASPTGYEQNGQRIWLNYLSPYIDESFSDPYGSVVAVHNPKANYKVVIEAHADEISWRVNYITEEGYIYVTKNGGSDHQIAPSKRVRIHIGEKKYVEGVFGWPAIHVRLREKETSPTLKNIFVDLGASSKKEVEKMGVHVGQVITFADSCFRLKEYWGGRGLDNRMGGFIIAEVMRRLHEKGKKLPFCLYVVNAVQEEIGLRGAEMISRRLKPNVALITDVCHDTHSPCYDKKTEGDIQCGKGPVVSYGATIHEKVRQHIETVAAKEKIPFQRLAAGRSTGTDTDAFAYSDQGVPSALLSLPLKYMHTTVEMAKEQDIMQTITLIEHFLLHLSADTRFTYL